jgi:hypothetical protein
MVNGSKDSVNTDDNVRYLFDQEAKHISFWRFVQEKNWAAVESFIDKKVTHLFTNLTF